MFTCIGYQHPYQQPGYQQPQQGGNPYGSWPASATPGGPLQGQPSHGGPGQPQPGQPPYGGGYGQPPTGAPVSQGYAGPGGQAPHPTSPQPGAPPRHYGNYCDSIFWSCELFLLKCCHLSSCFFFSSPKTSGSDKTRLCRKVHCMVLFRI